MTTAALPYDDLVWACTNLCDLLEVENDALANHDVRTVRELADNKSALARIYEQAVLPMAEDPSLAEDLEPEQREELTELGRRLHTLVQENTRRLKAEIEATERLMEAMANAVKASAATTCKYGKDGHLGGPSSAEKQSLSFNETL